MADDSQQGWYPCVATWGHLKCHPPPPRNSTTTHTRTQPPSPQCTAATGVYRIFVCSNRLITNTHIFKSQFTRTFGQGHVPKPNQFVFVQTRPRPAFRRLGLVHIVRVRFFRGRSARVTFSHLAINADHCKPCGHSWGSPNDPLMIQKCHVTNAERPLVQQCHVSNEHWIASNYHWSKNVMVPTYIAEWLFKCLDSQKKTINHTPLFSECLLKNPQNLWNIKLHNKFIPFYFAISLW